VGSHVRGSRQSSFSLRSIASLFDFLIVRITHPQSFFGEEKMCREKMFTTPRQCSWSPACQREHGKPKAVAVVPSHLS
jgi:hypothetical protein